MYMPQLKERVSNFMLNMFMSMAEDKVLEDTVREILIYLNSVTPSDLYEYASTNKGFWAVDEEHRQEWRKRIVVAAKGAVKFHKEQKVRDIIRGISPSFILENLLKESISGNQVRAVANLQFILSNKVVYAWFRSKVDEVRNWILSEYDSIVSQQHSV